MIKIMADSTCDLSPELIQKYNISILPLYIVMDEKSYRDGSEITPEEIYKWSDHCGKTPNTAAVGMEDALQIMKEYDKEDMDIIAFGISEEMSSTCNVLRLVSEELEHAKVRVINSKNLSTGIGLQVICAAELAKDGKTAEQIIAVIEENKDKVRASFVVDTMVYLQRGGRCNAVTALVASTLKIKPQISVMDGKMDVSRKFRGNMDTVVEKYIRSLELDLKNADNRRVFITHSGSPKELVDHVYNYLEGLKYFDEILITRAGGVVSSHCGPNTLGVLFYEK